MPRRFSRRSNRRTSPRRKLVWARTPFSGQVTAAAAPATAAPTSIDALSVFETSLGASPIGATVVRTRGVFQVSSAGANTEVIQVRLTAHIADNNYIDRGPNANDNAFDQLSMNRDFFIYEPFLVVGDNQTPDFAGSDSTSRLIDVKSSRKIEELNQTMVLEVHAFQPAGTEVVALSFTGDFSMLLMLP